MTRASSGECSLCGLPIIGRPVRSEERVFCCEGCHRVDSVAQAAGIDLNPASSANARDAAARKARAAKAVGARREVFAIEGMWCASCSLILTDALLSLPGVLDAEVSYAASLTRVTRDPALTTAEQIVERIDALGYQAHRADTLAPSRPDSSDLFLRLFVAVAVGMWVDWPTWLAIWPGALQHGWGPQRPLELFTAALSLVVLLYAGWPFLTGAVHAARVRRVTMDTLIVLGTWVAWVYSIVVLLAGPPTATYFDSASMITSIMLLGRWLESLSSFDAATSAGLVTSTSAEAWKLEDGSEAARVPADSLAVGDRVAVRPGEVVPIDGEVVEGVSEVDTSSLTGEAMPVAVGVSDEIWAGSINIASPLTIRVTRRSSDTLQGRLSSIAEDAIFAKTNAQRIADTVSALFVPVVLVIAAMALLVSLVSGAGLSQGLYRMVAVLVVACPCGLGLATPLAISNAVAAASKRGVLLRGGVALERATAVATVAFDKTGTLTEGRPRLVGLLGESANEEELVSLAASMETLQSHPIARALADETSSRALPVVQLADVRTLPGLGIEAKWEERALLLGNEALLRDRGLEPSPSLAEQAEDRRRKGEMVVWLAVGSEILTGLVFADPLRTSALHVVDELRSQGLSLAIVSGDARRTCESIARDLGIESVFAEVLPHEKEAVVRELSSHGPVAFVGDGANDVCALTAADLAIALESGSDIAVAGADAVLLSGDTSSAETPTSPLAAVSFVLALARKTRAVVRQNLLWSFTYNVVAIPLAASGRLSPILAAVAMVLSSLAVVVNSSRIRMGNDSAAPASHRARSTSAELRYQDGT